MSEAHTTEAALRFDDRVAIVTGAGRGLGRTYALELAKRGAKVVVNDLGGSKSGGDDGSASPADEVVAIIKEMGGDAVASYDSVSTAEGGEAIVQAALDAFGRVDVLVNNAGILRDKSFLKMEPEHWQAVLDVHLSGAYYVTRPAFSKMKEQGYGRIVMTTSAAGLYGNFGQANYAAAKMGLVGLMNVLAIEGGRYDIKVNTVAPVAASRLTEGLFPPDIVEKMAPEYVAPLVIFLCSSRCPESGGIYNAGMGAFNRAAVVTGSWKSLGTKDAPPTPEAIRDLFQPLRALDSRDEYPDAMAAVSGAMGAVPLEKSTKKKEKSGGDGPALTPETVAGLFEKMTEIFQPGPAKGLSVVFQYSITGECGGEWIVAVEDGTLRIEKGKADNPTTTLIMADEVFAAITTRQMSAMAAYSQKKLVIKGDLMKSQLIEKLFKF